MTNDTQASRRGQPCPCGSGKNFEDCCGPAIDGSRPATTAEQLMRSRFTAHVVRDHAYLHRTYQATAQQPYVEELDSSPINWTRLVVHSHEAEPKPGVSYVEFSAYFQEEDGEHVMQEKAEFHRSNGTWLYTRALRNGPAPVKVAPKVGRNDPCPCGSGKKYKHCCLSAPALRLPS